MNEYEFERSSGERRRVEAHRVEFAPGGTVVFWTTRYTPEGVIQDVLTLAVPAGSWFNLRQVQR